MAKHRTLLHESAYLSLFSVGLQGMGLLLNIFLTRRLGSAAVGILTLMSSFYGLAAVLSGGSGFITVSRFMSEAIGRGESPRRIFRYALRFCVILSVSCTVLLVLFAPRIVRMIPQTGATAVNLRLLSLTLPFAAVIACLKGRCYAFGRVYLPAIADCIEFLLRSGVMAFCAVFCIPNGKMNLLTAFAGSLLSGEGSTLLFLLLCRMPKERYTIRKTTHFGHFLMQALPIMGNACLVSLLSSANDALVPLTLLQYGDSTEQALAQFGQFEAIILPTLFFPSVIQCCMSGLLVPELSRARAANDFARIQAHTQRVLEQTMSFSLFVVLILVQFALQIGTLLGGDAFVGHILRVMSPVVPFIYLEIILEGVLRGLGKQNFSSVNYLAEYTVRISVLLICVPLFGFYGIVASYLACNLTGNAVRIYFVLRATDLHPNWKRILLRPAFALIISWQMSELIHAILLHFRITDLPAMTIYILICGGMYLFLLRVLDQLPQTKALSVE